MPISSNNCYLTSTILMNEIRIDYQIKFLVNKIRY